MRNGRFEREDAVRYYKNGTYHRDDGPAVEEKNGTKEWWVNGKLHREDGPAIEYPNGTKNWCLNGMFHREDGPAIIDADGTEEWFLYGEEVSEEEFNQWLEKKRLNEKLHATLAPRQKEKKKKI